jgi:hypothetical protein
VVREGDGGAGGSPRRPSSLSVTGALTTRVGGPGAGSGGDDDDDDDGGPPPPLAADAAVESCAGGGSCLDAATAAADLVEESAGLDGEAGAMDNPANRSPPPDDMVPITLINTDQS